MCRKWEKLNVIKQPRGKLLARIFRSGFNPTVESLLNYGWEHWHGVYAAMSVCANCVWVSPHQSTLNVKWLCMLYTVCQAAHPSMVILIDKRDTNLLYAIVNTGSLLDLQKSQMGMTNFLRLFFKAELKVWSLLHNCISPVWSNYSDSHDLPIPGKAAFLLHTDHRGSLALHCHHS